MMAQGHDCQVRGGNDSARAGLKRGRYAGFTLPEVMLASALLVTTLVFFLAASAQVSGVWWQMERQYRADAALQDWLLSWQANPPLSPQQGQLALGSPSLVYDWQIQPLPQGWHWQVFAADGELLEQGWYTQWGVIAKAP